MRHLLVTNDFPPKVGGIQTYLWELWRRLPPDGFAVLTGRQPGAEAFDAGQPFRVERIDRPVLLPTPQVCRAVERLAAEVGAGFVVLDPALPLGLIGPRLSRPYVVVGHGAEITVPGRVPGSRSVLTHVLRGCAGAVAGGAYVARELRRAAGGPLEVEVVAPGVDPDRFRPAGAPERRALRRGFGLPESGPLVLSVGRLVPRKGVDVLIDAVASLARDRPEITLAVAGGGRDRSRLERRALRRRAPARFLGRVPDDRLAELYACADVFAAPNRTRWGGLEQEGFGIVFVEAAACGVPQVGGDNGGVPEAVADDETGILVADPADPAGVAAAIARLVDDPELRARMGCQARERAVAAYAYPALAARLEAYLAGLGETLGAAPRPGGGEAPLSTGPGGDQPR